jgi:hypothetical protein
MPAVPSLLSTMQAIPCLDNNLSRALSLTLDDIQHSLQRAAPQPAPPRDWWTTLSEDEKWVRSVHYRQNAAYLEVSGKVPIYLAFSKLSTRLIHQELGLSTTNALWMFLSWPTTDCNSTYWCWLNYAYAFQLLQNGILTLSSHALSCCIPLPLVLNSFLSGISLASPYMTSFQYPITFIVLLFFRWRDEFSFQFYIDVLPSVQCLVAGVGLEEHRSKVAVH